MRGSTQGLCLAAGLLALLVVGASCSGAPLADPVTVAALPATGALPVSGSASDDVAVVRPASALPPPAVRRVGSHASDTGGSAAHEFVRTADEYAPSGETVPPSWSTPAPVAAPRTTTYAPMTTVAPPRPPPPNLPAGSTTPVYTTTAPCAPCAPALQPVAAVPLAQRTWSGCGLPCQDGISMWHARAVGGWSLWAGTDAPDDCGYWGLDLGRTHCGCWGYDLYYRYASGRFTRNDDPRATKDGGYSNHLGLKLTMERSFGRSRFYWWTGLGGGYFWSNDYLDNDDGLEVFGELGVGYVLRQNWRIRAGLNVHGMDTSMTRKNPADDGKNRWLWLIAPVIELEFDF